MFVEVPAANLRHFGHILGWLAEAEVRIGAQDSVEPNEPSEPAPPPRRAGKLRQRPRPQPRRGVRRPPPLGVTGGERVGEPSVQRDPGRRGQLRRHCLADDVVGDPQASGDWLDNQPRAQARGKGPAPARRLAGPPPAPPPPPPGLDRPPPGRRAARGCPRAAPPTAGARVPSAPGNAAASPSATTDRTTYGLPPLRRGTASASSSGLASSRAATAAASPAGRSTTWLGRRASSQHPLELFGCAWRLDAQDQDEQHGRDAHRSPGPPRALPMIRRRPSARRRGRPARRERQPGRRAGFRPRGPARRGRNSRPRWCRDGHHRAPRRRHRLIAHATRLQESARTLSSSAVESVSPTASRTARP